MNGIEKITGRIESDVQAEIDRLLEEAKAQAAEIAGQYQAQADAEFAELAAKSERIAAERKERLVRAAQMEARKTQLAAKQEMVERAYELALEKLCNLPEEQYVTVLTNLLVKAAGGAGGEVVFSPKDREGAGKASVERANALSGKHLVVSEETANIAGGFILRERYMEVNCAFETLVRLQKTETAGAVAKKLFPND